MICYVCEGSGWVNPNKGHRCSNCNGTGWIPITNPFKKNENRRL